MQPQIMSQKEKGLTLTTRKEHIFEIYINIMMRHPKHMYSVFHIYVGAD